MVACRHVGRLLLCVAFALLPSLRAVTMSRLRFWCRLCWWMLWITWHAIVSRHSPHYFRFSFPHHKLATLLFGACLSSFSSITQKRWAMWDQPVAYRPALQCPSPPLRYLAWVLSSPSYDPFITASPFSLSHAGLISLWHIVFDLHWLLTRCPGKSPLPGELPPLLGCNPKRSSNSSPDGDIPYSPLLQATMLPSYCMAGRCCPYCAIRRAELYLRYCKVAKN